MYKDTKESYDKEWVEFKALKAKYQDEWDEIQFSGHDYDGFGNMGLLERYLDALESQRVKSFEDYALDENSKFVRYLKRWPKGSKVLHLGCGTGREVLVGKSMGLHSMGITLGIENVAFGRHILGLTEDEIVHAPCEATPFKAESFDAVLGCQIFEHAAAPMMFLLEQGRVLKMGGEIVLEWPAASAHATNEEDPHHQVCYTPGQARGLLMKAGFRDIKLFYNDMSPILEENWWMGEQGKGYVIAVAKKAPSDVDYIVKSRR